MDKLKVILLKDYEDPLANIHIIVQEKDLHKAIQLIEKAVKCYEEEDYPPCCYELILEYLTDAHIEFKILGDADCVIDY